MLHVEFTQTAMPDPGSGVGQGLLQAPQFSTSRVRSLQPLAQLVCPLGQVAQSVPLALQVPLGHGVVAAAQVPLALHIAGSVSTPPAHDWPPPHNVPAPLLVVSTQTIEPVEHDV
jgi:hypothetical protein